MIKVIINGSKGRLGSAITARLQQHPNFSVLAEGTRTTDLASLIAQHKPDVVIDVTNSESVYENTKTIIASNVHPVIGSTGLLPEQIQTLQKLARDKKLGGIIAPNFSLGALLLMRFAGMAAHYFPQAEIIEMHHDKKREAPSGTAIKTAELIGQARIQDSATSQEILPGALGAQLANTRIHSVRLKSLQAHQEVLLAGDGELLTLRHDCFNRDAYLSGVILACEKVSSLNELIYGLDTLL